MYNIPNFLYFFFRLFYAAEDVGIILSKSPYSRKTIKFS